MTATSQMTKISSETLKKALKDNGGSNREVAERAGISFRAIAEARDGYDAEDLLSPRKRMGVVSSITRLAACLGLDPSTILKELGIDVSDVSVQRQVERANEASLLRSAEEDPVLRAMRIREGTVGISGPMISIVSWSPFNDDPGGGSFAKLIARSVMGSLNPDWERDKNLSTEKNFVEAEKCLLSSEQNKPDCVFGLYDLPWRNQGEVEVISLPGLYVRVGALCTVGFSWNKILASTPGAPLPHAMVIKGDIGDRMLRGPVDYPSGRLMLVETYDPTEIAARIEGELSKKYKDGFMFVADGPLVMAVKAALPCQSPFFLKEVDDRHWAPVVQFGFAVQHDATRFAALLSDAISGDLLGRALPRTVRLYLRLLENDRTNQIIFDPTDLDRHQPGLAARFIAIAMTLDNDAANTLRGAERTSGAVDTYITEKSTRAPK